MSDEKAVSDGPQTETSGSNEESSPEVISDNRQDSVKYDTYKRTVGEAKKYKGLYNELNEKFTNLEQRQLEAEGKKDELIEALRREREDYKNKYQTAVGSYAYKSISSEIVNEAVKMGCTNTKLLMKAVEDDLKTLDYDDNYNVDRDQIKNLLERTKQEHNVLFDKPAPSVKDGTPRTPEVRSGTSLEGLSIAEKAHLLATLDRTGKLK